MPPQKIFLSRELWGSDMGGKTSEDGTASTPKQSAPPATPAAITKPKSPPKSPTVEKLTTALKPKTTNQAAAKKPEAGAAPEPAPKAAAPAKAAKVTASVAVQAPKPAAPKQAAVAPPPALGKTAPPASGKPAAPDPSAPPVQPAAPVQSHSGVVSGPMRPMAPPRAMAKAEIFVDGDFVVYPTHGVGKVERIATEEIAGHKLELIHITFDENRMTLRVPTNKARTAGLRKLASQKQFDEVLATLKGRARIKRTMWSRRAQEYEAKINSGDPSAIAEVVRDLHRNAGQPDQSFSERQIYESALDRLAAEYAALEKVDKPTAIERLIAHLKSD